MFLPKIEIINKIREKVSLPFFITDKNTIVNRLNLLKDSFQKRMKIFYAIKANYNPHIIKILKDNGLDGIDAVSYYEVLLAKKMGFKSENILFTGVNNSREEIDLIVKENIILNIGSFEEFLYFSKKYKEKEFSIRINPGTGEGESKGVITAGEDSKFGIQNKDINKVLEIIKDNNLKLIGIHNHIGSGFYTTENFRKAVNTTINFAKKIKGLKFLDFGGGFGIRYKSTDEQIDLKDFYNSIISDLDKFEREYGVLEYRLEPGKFLVGESTCLVTKVTDIKSTENINFIGVDSGMNHLPRYALYGSFHNVENISNQSENKKTYKIVGNICESTDVICENINLPYDTKIGDILVIQTTGAYCSSMSSNYNLRPYASEVILDDNNFFISRKKMSFEDMYNSFGFEN